MNGLRIEWIQASFFIEMLVITWILMIPMKKREHFWQQGVLLVLAGSVIAAMDTNSNIKFILETAMIGFIAYRVYDLMEKGYLHGCLCLCRTAFDLYRWHDRKMYPWNPVSCSTCTDRFRTGYQLEDVSDSRTGIWNMLFVFCEKKKRKRRV